MSRVSVYIDGSDPARSRETDVRSLAGPIIPQPLPISCTFECQSLALCDLGFVYQNLCAILRIFESA